MCKINNIYSFKSDIEDDEAKVYFSHKTGGLLYIVVMSKIAIREKKNRMEWDEEWY